MLIVLSPGGVPGGVLDGELWLGCDVVGKGGIQTKFSPPQFLHSCVGGGNLRCGPVEKTPQRSIFLGLIVATRRSSRTPFSKKQK